MTTSKSIQHLVSQNGETHGPWTVETIAEKVANGGISITDFVWDHKLNDWVSLLEFSELKSLLQSRKPAPPTKITSLVTTAQMSEDDAIQWYVMRGQQKFGPFNFFGVVKALQDKSVFEFDHIWKEGMSGWVRVAEHEKFAADSIRTLLAQLQAKNSGGEACAQIFTQRRHARLSIENDVLINDSTSVSAGRMIEASAGGTGIIIKNSTLIPGQLIHVHFSTLEGLPAFNAIGEIVSKKFSRTARDTRAPIHYGVRFVKMDPAAEERVKIYFKNRAQQASA